MSNEINIKINNIDYVLNESSNRLIRNINEKVKLKAEFFPNPYGKNSSVIYVVANEDGKQECHLLECSILNKKCSREDYLKNKRPKIYSYVSTAQLIAINRDLLNIFQDKKEFFVV